MTGAFEVNGENENGERNVDLCAERKMDTTLQHLLPLQRYTTQVDIECALRDNVKLRSVIDFILVKGNMLRDVHEDCQGYGWSNV